MDIEKYALAECRSLEYAAKVEAHGGHETGADVPLDHPHTPT